MILSLLLARADNAANLSLSDGPPEHRTRADNQQTLLVSWWCTGFAMAFILVRLWGRAERVGKLFVEDKIMAWSMVPLLIRMACAHVVLYFGTNNSQVDGASERELYHRSIGARLVLVSRIFYALFIWTAKWTVSEYLKRITSSIWTGRQQLTLHCIRIFLVVTFVGVVIGTLSECQPFKHYWQVVPDPGPNCRNGYAQLLVMGTADIITDIVLIAFPIQLVWSSSFTLKRKIGLSFLFSFSLALIAITAYRMPAIIEARGRQQLRTLWASLEILAASIVANALVLGSFVRDKGAKRAKYRGARGTIRNRADSAAANGFEPSINREMTKQHWGNDSDENLFRSCRGRLDSTSETVASADASATTRPLWSLALKGPYAHGKSSDTSEHALVEEEETTDIEDPAAEPSTSSSRDYYAPITPPEAAQTRPTRREVPVNGAPPPPAAGAAPTLADVGGLLHYSPPPTAHTRPRRADSSTDSSRRSPHASLSVSTSPRRSCDSNVSPTTVMRAPRPPRPPPLVRIESQGASLELNDPGGLLGSPVAAAPAPAAAAAERARARPFWHSGYRSGGAASAAAARSKLAVPTLSDPGGLLK